MSADKPMCFVVRESQREKFDHALSDFLCWIEGFKAGGGTYSPGSEYTLRDLRDTIDRAYQTTEASLP